MRNKVSGIFLALCVWVLNPAYLVGCGESGFSFGQEEMLVLMETIEDGSWELDRAGENYTLVFSLEQSAVYETAHRIKPGMLDSALACEDRSFVAAASACMDMTRLEVQGTVDVRDSATGALIHSGLVVTGEMNVVGLDLNNASLNLVHDDGEFSFYSSDGMAFSLGDASW